MKPLPDKIAPDAIREALLEIRFEHPELGEVVLGKIAGHPRFAASGKVRLPGAEIPEQLRSIDANLRNIPSLEIRVSAAEVIRVGFNVLSYHNVGTYLGWKEFLPRLLDASRVLFEVVPELQISRLGLRYVNVLTQREHFVESLYDLNLQINVEGEPPSPNVQLIYQLALSADLEGMVRVITPNFVTEGLPPGSVALIDVDIYTNAPIGISEARALENWLDRAHIAEKAAFFSLLKDETVSRLQEA